MVPARIIMIQDGANLSRASVLSIRSVYPRIGGNNYRENSLEKKGVNGNHKECLTSKSSRTGEDGRKIIIGRNKIIGVFEIREMTEGITPQQQQT